jgi:hypothetical protein
LTNPSTIRSILAVFFLLLFAFCITPTRTLHNLVANHTDKRIHFKTKDPYQSQISKLGFHCQCDNLVSESPFVAETGFPAIGIAPAFVSCEEKLSVFFYPSHIFCSGLRGPPAC